MTRGLISELDARTLETTLLRIMQEFVECAFIHITEVGMADGNTARGMKEVVDMNSRAAIFLFVDNEALQKVQKPFLNCRILKGNSSEMYWEIEDASQHLVFIDANHSYPCVVQDFFCYMDKVRPGGYMAFHDTGEHIKPFSGYQSGNAINPDSFIAVRKALKKIGLLDNRFEGWEKVFDTADVTDEMGGVCVFKKKEA